MNRKLREEQLKLKYPVGTKGRIGLGRAYTSLPLLQMGWLPEMIAVVESAYVSMSGDYECLKVRWGEGEDQVRAIEANEFYLIEGDRT